MIRIIPKEDAAKYVCPLHIPTGQGCIGPACMKWEIEVVGKFVHTQEPVEGPRGEFRLSSTEKLKDVETGKGWCGL